MANLALFGGSPEIPLAKQKNGLGPHATQSWAI